MRPRACAAILQGDHILMVHHRHDGREYWTLPGGGIEPGETPEDAAVREVWEETGLRATVVRFLFEETYLNGTSPSYCFLLQAERDGEPIKGADPEEAHLTEKKRMLQGVAWLPLSTLTDDGQIAQVLKAMTRNPND